MKTTDRFIHRSKQGGFSMAGAKHVGVVALGTVLHSARADHVAAESGG